MQVHLTLKFNNGNGALVCHCGHILAKGFDHEGTVVTCHCEDGAFHEVIRINTSNPSVYFFGYNDEED